MAAIERGDTLVVPSRQRAHAVRIAHAHYSVARQRRAWHSPAVLPLDAWIEHSVGESAIDDDGPRVLSTAEEWWLWREATSQATQDAGLIGAPTLTDSLRRADRLATDYGIDVGRWLAAGGPETRLLHEAQHFMRRACLELGADTALRRARLAPAIGAAGAVHFAGFQGPASQRAHRLFAARRVAGLPGEWLPIGARATSPIVELAADEDDETAALAQWCLDSLERAPDARLLVIAAGAGEWREGIAARVRAALAPRSKLAGTVDADLVAIEGGAPLERQALVRHALASLGWLVEGLEFEEFSDWLLSPYGPLPRAAGARLDLWWRRHAPLEADARASLARLAQAAAGGLEPAAALATKVRSALAALDAMPARTRTWSERFLGALDALRADDAPDRSSLEQQAWLRLVALFDEYGGLSRVIGSLDARQALRVLRELAARTAWQATTGDAIVSIAATHEDPVARYDGIWVAGLAADAWPAPPLADPFIPLPALREAGVAAADPAGQLAAAHASLEAWRAATQALVLSSPTSSGDMQVASSPLLATGQRGATRARATWLPLRVRGATRLEPCDDEAGRPWPRHFPLPGGTRSIELQAACPFRAYAEMQLGATVLDEPAPGVSPAERGRWLHRAFEIFWRDIRDSVRLCEFSATALQELAGHAVDAAREEALDPPRAPTGATRSREARRLANLIATFAQLEQARPPFRVESLEDARQIELGEARLSVRIDRVDRLGEGGRAIIDYKSGKPSSLDWFGERPTAAQLLVYLSAFGDEVRALAYARVASPAPRFQGVAAADGVLPRVAAIATADGATAGGDGAQAAWTHQLGIWRAQTQGFAQEFLRGHATVTPAAGACRHCHLAALCRIGERMAIGTEEGADA